MMHSLDISIRSIDNSIRSIRNVFSSILNNDSENSNFINENSVTNTIDDNNTTEEHSNNPVGNSSSGSSSNGNSSSSSGISRSIKNWFEFLVMPSTNKILDCFLYGDDSDINTLILRFPQVCTVPYSFDSSGNNSSSTATNSSSAANNNSEPLYPLAIVCRRPKETLMETIIAIYNIYPDAIHLNPTLHYSCGVTTRRRRRVNQQEQEQEERRRKLSLDITKFLISQYPNSVTKVEKGFLPLHVACAASYGDSSNASYDIINYLIQCYPNSIQQPIEITDSDSNSISSNKLPLHIAIESKASINIVQLLVSKYPKALQIPDYKLASIRYEYIGQQREQKQKRQKQKQQKQEQEQQENGYWIIHKRTSPMDTSSSSASSSDNSTVITVIINDNEQQQVQQKQVQQKQEIYDDGCGLPLHLACKNINNYNYNETTFQIVDHLIQLYPDALITKNYNGWLPIHFACHSTKTSLSLIELLVTKCPNSLAQCTNNSRYPIDMVFTNMKKRRKKMLTAMNDNTDSGTNHVNDGDPIYTDVMLMKIKYLLSKHDIGTATDLDNNRTKKYLLLHYLKEAEINFVSSKVIHYLREELHKVERSLTELLKPSVSVPLPSNTICGTANSSSNLMTDNSIDSTQSMLISTH